jgi:hypothetical protein
VFDELPLDRILRLDAGDIAPMLNVEENEGAGRLQRPQQRR